MSLLSQLLGTLGSGRCLGRQRVGRRVGQRVGQRVSCSLLFAIALCLTHLGPIQAQLASESLAEFFISALDPYQSTPDFDSPEPVFGPQRPLPTLGPIAQEPLPPDIDPYQIAPPLDTPPPPPPRVQPAPAAPVPAVPETPAPVPAVPATPAQATAPQRVPPRVIEAPPAQADGKTIKVTLPDPSIKPINLAPPRPQFPALPRQEVRGVWMTTEDMEILLDRNQLRSAIDQLASVNFNTLYPVVWNSGYALHPSAVARRVGSPHIYRGEQNQDPLKDIIEQGHRDGLSVMPWFEFGFMAPPSSELIMQHPDWITQKRNGEATSVSAGGEVVWLNPLRPEVQRFLTDLVMEVVNNYDVDGIQFDDHMSLPRDFGYDSYTQALYKQETGKNPPENAADEAWIKWRADKITEFVGDLHDAIKTAKPKVVFSVSPNYQDFAYRFHLQDWLNWVRQGFVDEIVVQVYRDDYNSFIGVIDRPEIKETQQKISTGIAILSGLPRRPIFMQQIQQQSRAAQQRGLGVAFFYYKSLWDDAPEAMGDRKSGFRALFPNPMSRLASR
ncbi:MAG: family 10 glycosylhydrolase [Synechococcales cyanobacterium CRU_2_2]|nr:family 10 glycosylhydrolase [Synechococcales cyanobacterium CRU_2_2]